jgi:hypothetical protein
MSDRNKADILSELTDSEQIQLRMACLDFALRMPDPSGPGEVLTTATRFENFVLNVQETPNV